MRDLNQYPFEIRPLTKEEGRGFLISFPDFGECISAGDTPEQVIRNVIDALSPRKSNAFKTKTIF